MRLRCCCPACLLSWLPTVLVVMDVVLFSVPTIRSCQTISLPGLVTTTVSSLSSSWAGSNSSSRGELRLGSRSPLCVVGLVVRGMF